MALAKAPSFHDQVVEILPRLRAHAMGLTGSRPDADDLLQETACRALRAQSQFTTGTNFQGWMYRIMRNEFVTRYRAAKRAPTALDYVPSQVLARDGTQEDQLLVREVTAAMQRLTAEHREVLVLICMGGVDYATASMSLGCSIGTVKSRLFRARRQIQALIMGEESPPRTPTMATGRPLALA